MSRKILRHSLVILLSALSILALLGCQQNSPSSGLSNPFISSMSFFTLKGYSSGYVPGEKYDFELTLDNKTEETWQSKYSVYLIDRGGVALNIVSQRPFTVPAEASMNTSFNMTLPANLQEGKYGLMVVFPGQGTSITTIQIGEETASESAPISGQDHIPAIELWPDINSLPEL